MIKIYSCIYVSSEYEMNVIYAVASSSTLYLFKIDLENKISRIGDFYVQVILKVICKKTLERNKHTFFIRPTFIRNTD